MLVIGGMGSANERTPTARTTARGRATTPPNASSCVENSTDSTVISTNTCRRGDSGRTPDAEEGAGRKVKPDSNRTQTTRVRVGVGVTRRRSRERRRQDTDPGMAGMQTPSINRTQTTRVRVGVGATRRSSRERRRQDTDPGLADMRTPSPEDVATTAIIIRAGAAEAGARASGRCHRLIFRLIRRRVFRLICRLENFPTHRGTHLRQIIPTRTNTWDTRGGGSQRGTGHHHHRQQSWGLPSSSSSSTNNTKSSKRARLLPRLPLLLQLSLLRLPAQLKPAELLCSSSSHVIESTQV